MIEKDLVLQVCKILEGKTVGTGLYVLLKCLEGVYKQINEKERAAFKIDVIEIIVNF